MRQRGSAAGHLVPGDEARMVPGLPKSVRYALVGTFATEGFIAIMAASAGLWSGGEDSFHLYLFGLVNGFAAVVAARSLGPDPHFHRREAMVTITLQWMLMILIGTLPYLLSGVLPNFLDALYDSTAGFTTTSTTTIPDVEVISDAMQFWRAGTQWMGAFSALTLFVVIAPRVGLVESSTGPDSLSRQGRELSRTPYGSIMRIGLALGFLSSLLTVGYLVAGMDIRDAAFHGLTTSSTGGFSTRNNSIAAFDSAGVEWVALGGMVAAGASVVHVIRIARGALRSVWRSVELRVYLGLLGFGTLFGWAANSDEEGLRTSLFAASSALSTTGLRASEIATWESGSLVVLFVLVTIGSMGGSPGGGLRVLTVSALFSATTVEFRKSLYPRMVGVAKLGRTAIARETLDRISGQLFLASSVIAIAFFLITAFGAGMLDGLSAVLSAFANAGPVVGTLEVGTEQAQTVSSFDNALVFGSKARVVLLLTMFLGRLAVHPVLVTAGIWSHHVRHGSRSTIRRLRRVPAWSRQ